MELVHAFVTSVGFEEPLEEEIGAGEGRSRWPGVVAVPRFGEAPADPVFARQGLPAAVAIKETSVATLAEAVYAAVAGAVDRARAGVILHAYVPDPEAYAHLAGRAALVGEALAGLLRRRRRRSFGEGAAAWSEEVLLVQAALVGRTSVLVSSAHPRRLPRGGWDLAPWPAGIAPVAEDRAAPSRAYGKLEEAFAWLGAAPAPGERCVDLGGAPGGWAWRALARGAEVVAVDRAPLEPPAAGHPRLTSIQGDAFRYRPATPVDWLLCDVICEPPRTVELVERWVAGGWCRRLVATLKFKGRAGYPMLAEARRRLEALPWAYVRFKHLHRHHNEVAVMASDALPAPPSG